MQQEVTPLSRHQRAIWLEALLYPNRPIFNIGTYVLLSGIPDIHALERAIQSVIQKHDALRMCVSKNGPQAQLTFKESQSFQLNVVHFSSLHDAKNWMEQDFITPIDINANVLFDIQLVCFKKQAFLYLKHHHIYIDGWGRALLVREIAAEYNALQSNVQRQAVPSYQKYLQRFARPTNPKSKTYWLETFSSFERSALFNPKEKGVQMPSKRFLLQWKSPSFFRDNSQKDQFYLQLASLAITLANAYSKDEITIGIPLLNRFNEEERTTIGYFVGLIPLRISIPNDVPFYILVDEIRQKFQESRNYRDLSIQEINHAIGMQNSDFHQAYDVVFSFEPHDHNGHFGSIKALEAGTFSSDFEQNPLVIHAQQFIDANSVDFVFDYNVNYLEKESVANLASRWERVLNTIIARTDLQLPELPLLDESEQQSIDLFSQGKTEKLRHSSMFDWVSKRLTNASDEAVLFDGAQQFSFRQIHVKAYQLATQIQTLNVSETSHVGIVLPRSANVILAIAGCLYAGVPYVYIDPNLGIRRHERILEDANVCALISDIDGTSNLPIIHLNNIDSNMPWSLPKSNLDAPIYAFFTSGSTGVPKGVSIPHRGIVNLMQELESSFFQETTSDSKLALVSSFAFDASVQFVFAHLCLGLPLYIVPETARKDGRELAAFLVKHGITHSDGIPSHLTSLYLRNAEPPKNFLTHRFLIGGEAMDKSQITRFFEWCNRPVRLTNAYGPTECSVDATLHHFDATSLKSDTQIPIGKPVINSSIHLLDPRGIPVPPGGIGEICISGYGLADGYLNASDATKKAFVQHPKIGRIYTTGDLGKWLPDGSLQFMGRKDRQVKIRGFRIELKEVEAALNKLSGVDDSYVFIKKSEHAQILIAALQTHEFFQEDELRSALMETLPEYMVPNTFHFLEVFPKTASGKTDRKQLEALKSTTSVSNKQPETDTEREVAIIVSAILDIELPDVTKSFFALGGDSLSLVYLIAELEETFHLELPIHQVSDRNAIREIATFLDHKIEDEVANIDLESAVNSALNWEVPNVLPNPATASSALLTGATGFVGAFLLEQLLTHFDTVFCVIRSASELHAHLRLKAALECYEIDLDPSDPRIRYIAGDLSQPQLGLSDQKWTELSESVGAIYHNGAEVHFLKNTQSMYASNVGGTSELLRLSCTATLKRFHFVSTVGIFSEKDIKIDENHTITHQIHSENRGYETTKWIAEGLIFRMRAAGIPCSIYRLARVTGHSQSGISNYTDFFHRFIIGCLDIGYFPQELLDRDTDLTPIDMVVEGILALSKSDQRANYHLINPHRLKYKELLFQLKEAGRPLTIIDTNTFLKIAANSSQSGAHPLYTIMPILKQKTWFSVNSNRFEMRRTLEDLNALNIYWTEAHKLLPTYIHRWIQQWNYLNDTTNVKTQ